MEVAPMTATCETTIRDIVAADYRAASVFQRHGLDFCCGGARTVEDACGEAGIDTRELLAELERTLTAPASGVPRFGEWDLPTLVTYIIGNHHAYVRAA